MKYSHQIIRTSQHIELISSLMEEEILTINHILPTLVSKYAAYPYLDGKSLKAAFKRATQDAIDGEYSVRDWLRFTKRIYICAGKAKDDSDFNTKILEMKQLANYIEANKNEI